MKRFLLLTVFAVSVLCGYLLVNSIAAKAATQTITVTSPLTLEKKDKHFAGIVKKAAKKSAVHKQKTLTKISAENTITMDAKNKPQTSPRDINPSGKYW